MYITFICVFIYLNTDWICTYKQNMYIYIYIHMKIYIYIKTHTYMHACMHTYIDRLDLYRHWYAHLESHDFPSSRTGRSFRAMNLSPSSKQWRSFWQVRPWILAESQAMKAVIQKGTPFYRERGSMGFPWFVFLDIYNIIVPYI